MKRRYVPPTDDLLLRLSQTLRPCDAEELRAGGSTDLFATLKESCRVSDESYVFCEGEEPIAVFGIASQGAVGIPWLLGSTLLDVLPRIVLTESRAIVHNMMKKHDRLENLVYVKNLKSRRWLKWLGFSEEEPAPHGPHGELFCRFYWERENV